MTVTLLLFFILVNGVLGLFIRSLPPAVFNETFSIYQMRLWEKRLYRRLGLHKWKNRLPQAGWMTGFSRKRLPNAVDTAYAERFIWETCCAMLGHFVMAFAGLLFPLAALLPWAHNKDAWFAGLWFLAVLHFLIQILYVMIQRYNLPRFVQLRERLRQQKFKRRLF
ncbi:MAG: hypothetical protein LBI04_12390 [Treponema sp.]|nr:hypothetical protein [Treponema sp.]